MQIVTFPPALVEWYVGEARRLMETGQVAEARYFKEEAKTYVPGKLSLPVSSGGTALYALLAYQKHVKGKKLAIVQSNTMRALYTVPSLLDMKPLVVASSYEDFLAMNDAALEKALADESVRRDAVVLYSVIGGYLAPSFARIVEICRKARVPLVIDAAHAHYLPAIARENDVDVAYSFYATKILPAGEGGLVSTASQETHDWLRRFLMYDRFHNELEVGINLRAGELTSALVHKLMTDASLADHFRDARVEIAARYEAVCKERGIRYLAPAGAADYNGYKFIVLDPRERLAGTSLTEHPATSGVFDTDVRGGPTSFPHWCPPTYPSLRK
jgi:perosamine synthetase